MIKKSISNVYKKKKLFHIDVDKTLVSKKESDSSKRTHEYLLDIMMIMMI